MIPIEEEGDDGDGDDDDNDEDDDDDNDEEGDHDNCSQKCSSASTNHSLNLTEPAFNLMRTPCPLSEFNVFL